MVLFGRAAPWDRRDVGLPPPYHGVPSNSSLSGSPVLVPPLLYHFVRWLPERFKQRYRLAFAALPLPLMVLAVAVVVLIAYQFITADMQPFIYFQF